LKKLNLKLQPKIPLKITEEEDAFANRTNSPEGSL
jgi:hypothetical protein